MAAGERLGLGVATYEVISDRRTIVVPPGANILPYGEASKVYYGFRPPGDVALSLVVNRSGVEHKFIVVRPPEHRGTSSSWSGVSVAAASILRVEEGEGSPKPIVSEAGAVRLLAGELVTVRQLLDGQVRKGSEVEPPLSDYDSLGNGLIWLDYRGSLAVSTLSDDPSIDMMYPPETTGFSEAVPA